MHIAAQQQKPDAAALDYKKEMDAFANRFKKRHPEASLVVAATPRPKIMPNDPEGGICFATIPCCVEGDPLGLGAIVTELTRLMLEWDKGRRMPMMRGVIEKVLEEVR